MDDEDEDSFFDMGGGKSMADIKVVESLATKELDLSGWYTEDGFNGVTLGDNELM